MPELPGCCVCSFIFGFLVSKTGYPKEHLNGQNSNSEIQLKHDVKKIFTTKSNTSVFIIVKMIQVIPTDLCFTSFLLTFLGGKGGKDFSFKHGLFFNGYAR